MPSSITLPVGGFTVCTESIALSGGPGPPWTTRPTYVTSDSTKVQLNPGVYPDSSNYASSITTSGQVCAVAIAAGTATVTVTLGTFTDTLTITVSANEEVNVTGVSLDHNP